MISGHNNLPRFTAETVSAVAIGIGGLMGFVDGILIKRVGINQPTTSCKPIKETWGSARGIDTQLLSPLFPDGRTGFATCNSSSPGKIVWDTGVRPGENCYRIIFEPNKPDKQQTTFAVVCEQPPFKKNTNSRFIT